MSTKKPNADRPIFRVGNVVYILREGLTPGGRVKIGTSDLYARRYAQLQRKSPRMLKTLAVVDGDRKLEAGLHEQFKDRALGHEWFEDADGALSRFADRLHHDDAFTQAVRDAILAGGPLPAWEGAPLPAREG